MTTQHTQSPSIAAASIDELKSTALHAIRDLETQLSAERYAHRVALDELTERDIELQKLTTERDNLARHVEELAESNTLLTAAIESAIRTGGAA